VTQNEGNSSSTPFNFMVTRTNTNGPATVDWAVTGGATNPADADDFPGGPFPNGTASFADGNPSATITVNVSGDTAVEPTETFTVTLSNPSGGAALGATSTATGTITNDDSSVSISNAVVLNEGNSGFTPFEYTLTRTNTTGAASVEWEVDGSGTNQANSADFGGSFPDGTANFADGVATAQITVNVSGDSAIEPDDTFTVTISNPSGTNLGSPATASGTIQNDDSSTMSIGTAVALNEGNGGSTPFAFTVTRTNTTGSASVQWAVTGGATNPADADDFPGGPFPNGTANFADGNPTATITVNVSGDTDIEPNETFTVTLSNPSGGATLGTATATGTIQNDDSNTISIGPDVALNEGNSGSTPFNFTVTRSNTAVGATVSWAVTGTGVSPAMGSDFTIGSFPSGMVTFSGSSATATITFNVAGDTAIEPAETFTVTLSSPTGGATLGTATATGTINNDDSATISMGGNITQNEGNSGPSAFVFEVNRTGDTSGTASASYTVAGSGASPADGADFTGGTLPTGTASFGVGETSTDITINVSGDTAVEPNETFTVTLNNPTGGTIGTTAALGMISNDDSATVYFSASTFSGPENTGANLPSLFVNGTILTTSTVTVTASGAGTATGGGVDYNFPTSQVVTIAPGSYNGTTAIPVPNLTIVNDGVIEADETIVLNLSSPSGNISLGSPTTTTYTIENDDSYAIVIDDVSFPEGDSGQQDFNFTVSIVGGLNALTPVTFTYNTGNGTATFADNDYEQLNNQTGTIAVGSSSTTITVEANGDNKQEGNETFTVNLSNPSANATISDGQGLGTIQNDDSAAVLIGPISGNTTESGGTATFRVSLSQPPLSSVIINLQSSDPGEGTVQPSVTLNSGNWSTGVVVTVTGVDDSVVDGLQPYTIITNNVISLDPFYLVLNGGDVENVDVFNDDNDSFTVSITAPDAAAAEEGSDNGSFTIDLGLVNGAAAPVLINYSIGGTASNSDDYTGISNSVSIANGQRSATLVIDPIDDDLLETSETVILSLLPSPNYILGNPSSAQVSITDNDMASLTITDASGAEGEELEFEVTLNNGIAGGISATIGFINETATGGAAPLASPEDFDNTPVVLNFDGSSNQTIEFTVQTLVDVLPEGTESFTSTLNASNPLIDVSDTGTGTITDSDTDEDGLLDGLEADLGTDPFNPDSDDDGIDDEEEVGNDTANPDDEDEDGIIDALDSNTADTDGDSFNDQQDPANEDGCIPNNLSATCDTDGDGISDGEEMENGTDHLDPCDPDINSPACQPGDVDLSLSKELENPTPNARYDIGDHLIFRATVTNLSTEFPAVNIPVQEVIQNGFVFIATLSDSDYDPELSLWRVQRLDPGESAELRIEVEIVSATDDGELENSVLLDLSYTSDINPENNAATVDGIFVDLINEQDPGFLYNEFSPNGDGVNDFLVVNNIDIYTGVHLQVFDRYGNKVFEESNYDNSWDGTGDNGNMPKGTYFYILDLGDGTEVRKGWIQIIR
jgi:gliding motility-associated-like protein